MKDLSTPVAIYLGIAVFVLILGMFAVKRFCNSIDMKTDEEKDEDYEYRHYYDD